MKDSIDRNGAQSVTSFGAEASNGNSSSLLKSPASVQITQSDSQMITTPKMQISKAGIEMESGEVDADEESESDEDNNDRDTYFDEDASSYSQQELDVEVPLTEEEIEDLINQLVKVESKAAEAQEMLEEEPVSVLRDEVKAELAEKSSGAELNRAVEEEIATYVEQWQDVLDDLEDQSALLQERLDDAGVNLPDLFKWIEKQAPEGCTTEAWRKRTHWAGFQASQEVVECVQRAECNLEMQRPVKRHHGKLIEEGASGYLSKKLTKVSTDVNERTAPHCKGWESIDAYLRTEEEAHTVNLYGSKAWASVYLASTPEQAALLGLPGADQVEEIEDLDKCEKNPFYAAAVASEKEFGLTEQQKRNIKKVREEDDIKKAQLMQRVTFKLKRSANKKKKLNAGIVPTGLEQDVEEQMTHQIRTSMGNTLQSANDTDRKNQLYMATTHTGPGADNETTSMLSDSMVAPNTMLHSMQNSVQSCGEVDGVMSRLVKKRPMDYKESLTKKTKLLMDDEFNLDGIEADCNKDGTSEQCLEGKVLLALDHCMHRNVINIESDEEEQESIERKAPDCSQEQSSLFKSANADGVESTKVNDNISLQQSRTMISSLGFDENKDNRMEEAQDEMVSVRSLYKREELQTQPENDKDFMCTCCGIKLTASEVLRHPFFEIMICFKCRVFYQSGPFSKDAEGTEEECRWCGNGGNVILCERCDRVFCQSCITLNFGQEKLNEILQEDWVCFCCNSEPLQPLIEHFRKARDLGKTETFAEDASDTDEVQVSSEESFEARNREEEKSRKRIRRIMDDDELDEATKHKLALEEERKQRLETLREAAKCGSNIPVSGRGIAHMASEDSTLAETRQDCIINLARDMDEEEVLIPWGISKFLKPHQIAGVRFMWENCIESMKKVKSGECGNGCILAHSMGLGKTLQVIAFLYTVLKKKDLGLRTALIVAPVNVLHNWPDEFEKWNPPDMKSPPVLILDDSSRDNTKRASLLTYWQKHGGVMIIGYTAFRNLSLGKHIKDKAAWEKICKALQNPGPDLLICDEAHMIKNRKADITQSLKQVRTQRRIALTGSPLQNNLMEYYCMVDFVREGFLGRPHEFRNRFQNPIENGQHADSTQYDVRVMKQRTHVLHKQLTGFVQRMGANVVEKELPSKQNFVISVRLSTLQRALYNRFIQLFWLSKEQSSSVAKSRKCLFNTYHSLSKIWNHPDLLWLAKEERDAVSDDSMDEFIVDDCEDVSSDEGVEDQHPRKEDGKFKLRGAKKGEIEALNEMDILDWCHDLVSDTQRGLLENSGKMVLLMNILSMSSAKGEKALVFSQSLLTLNLIEMFLERLPRPRGKSGCWRKDKEWYRLDGQTKAKERQRLVQRFNNPVNTKVQCVLISTRAGSLGINLQAANRVIIVDGSWNPTHDIQALFRAWRFGQTKPVVAYRLLAYGTAEEKIYKRQVAKEGLAARVLDEQQVTRQSSKEELRVLFKLDDGMDESPEGNCQLGDVFLDTVPNDNVLDSSMYSDIPSLKRTVPSFFRCLDLEDDALPEDDLMASLLINHRPRWIVRIHQHETLLEEIEDEKLTLEEQALAWESFKRSMDEPDVEWVQVDSQSGEYIASHVLNSWTTSAQAASFCDGKTHANLLVSRNVKNHEHIKCDICLQDVGWEHVTKFRSRGR